MMPSTRQHPASTNSTESAAITDTAKAGSSPSHVVLKALVVLGFLILTGCGGGYRNAQLPNQTQNQNSVAQVWLASDVPTIQIGGTLLVFASAAYQNSPNEFDVTNTATWTTSNAAIATVAKGLVTGTGVGSVTISATFGGRSGTITVFVGLTGNITISPLGPFSLSATPQITFYATETFSDGSTLDVSGPAFWSTGPGGVIGMYPYLGGYATLVATGTTTITATLSTGQVATLTVTVVP